MNGSAVWTAWICLALVLAASLRAEEISIDVVPEDSPLVLIGTPDAGGKLSRSLRLTARGGGLESFSFLPSDLRIEGTERSLDRRHVTLVGADRKLEAEVARDFVVEVSGLERAGTYRGQIQLGPGKPQKWTVLPLVVRVEVVQPWIEFDVPELVLEGDLDDERKLSRTLRLTARGGDVSDFDFLPSDLSIDTGGEFLDRGSVTLVGTDRDLHENRPEDRVVEVTDLLPERQYRGEIVIGLSNQPDRQTTLPVRVVTHSVPDLTASPGTKELELNLVRCGDPSCWLARIFLSKSATTDVRDLEFSNRPSATVELASVSVAGVVGEYTGYQLTDTQLSGPSQGEDSLDSPAVRPERYVKVPLSIDRSEIPADHYTGTVSVSFATPERSIDLPLNLNIRSGPVGPLVVLFIGLAFGRLVRYFQTTGSMQADLLTELARLEDRIRDWPQGDRDIVQKSIDETRQLVYQRRLTEAQAGWTKAKGRSDILENVRRLEQVLDKLPTAEPEVGEARNKLGNARIELRLGNDQTAATSVEAARSQLEKYLQRPKPEAAAEFAQRAATQANSVARSVRQSANRIKSVSEPSLGKRVNSWLIRNIGASEQLTAESMIWLRPLLYVALLLGLLAVGINEFYVEKGATFGARPFPDYLGLVLWGLSADVASRTLSNLRGG